MRKALVITLIVFTALTGRGQVTTQFAKPVLFETAFADNPYAIDSTIVVKFLKFRLGLLKIESGSLVIADPIVLLQTPVIPYTFPIGSFPVEIAVNYADSSELSSLAYVSYCRIIFSDKAVAKWELLLEAGKDSAFKNDIHYTALSESGVIMDVNARKAVSNLSYEEWSRLFIDSLNDYNQFRQWKLHKIGNHDLVMYRGISYPGVKLYIGYDKEGKIVRLLIDGGMFFLSPSLY